MKMETSPWPRDVGSDISSVKGTFSSWDGCMSKGYCKWPVIAAIIIASLVLLAVVACCARCLCCGGGCCCGCCNDGCCCCSSRRRRDNRGYQQAPPMPMPYYQPPPPMYASGGTGYRSANIPQSATFDAPGKNGATFNEDALPPMPSWDNATVRRERVAEDVEMEKLGQGSHARGQEAAFTQPDTGRYYNGGGPPIAGQDQFRSGGLRSANASPLQNSQQFASPPLSAPAQTAVLPYGSSYNQFRAADSVGAYGASHTRSPGAGTPRQHASPLLTGGYEPSLPPSYRTQPPSNPVSPVSPQEQGEQRPWPVQSQYQAYSGPTNIGRKPVQGSWREI